MTSMQDLAGVLFVMAAEQEFGPALRSRIKASIVGVGPVEAAIGTITALQRRADAGTPTRLIVSLGSSASSKHAVGSIWQVSSVAWRDMDATPFGFAKGVTPFADHPARIDLTIPPCGLRAATLTTSAAVVGVDGWNDIEADLVDMETFAVVRAGARLGVPVAGLRGVSDGPGSKSGGDGWRKAIAMLDERLASALDELAPALERAGGN